MITVLTRPGFVPDAGLVVTDARQVEELLRERRIDRGLTIINAAAAAGLSRNAMGDLESPRHKSKLVTATKYAAALDLRFTVRVPAGSQPAGTGRRGALADGAHPVIAALALRRRSLYRTQDWLARQIHRSPESISRWESGTQQSLLEDAIWYAVAVQARLVLCPIAATVGAR